MAPTFKGNKGDLIEIFRGPYQHWAVYIGGQKVVHFTTGGGQSSGSLANLSSSTGKVKREKLAKVVGNHRFKVNNLLDEEYKARDPSVIVEEACTMVGRELQYNVATYNCEHFATEMRYGEAETRQVIKTAITVAAVVAPIAQVAAVFADPVVAIATVAGGAYAFGAALFHSLSSSQEEEEDNKNKTRTNPKHWQQ